jgi:hypothetical protein
MKGMKMNVSGRLEMRDKAFHFPSVIQSSSLRSRDPSKQYTLQPRGAPIAALLRYTMSASQKRHHCMYEITYLMCISLVIDMRR